MRKFTSANAKNRFGELIDAARLAPVAVTKYNKPFVVVMAAEEFERIKVRAAPQKEQEYQGSLEVGVIGHAARHKNKVGKLPK